VELVVPAPAAAIGPDQPVQLVLDAQPTRPVAARGLARANVDQVAALVRNSAPVAPEPRGPLVQVERRHLEVQRGARGRLEAPNRDVPHRAPRRAEAGGSREDRHLPLETRVQLGVRTAVPRALPAKNAPTGLPGRRAMARLAKTIGPPAGIVPSATTGQTGVTARTVMIGRRVMVEAGVMIGPRVMVESGVMIGRRVMVEAGVMNGPRVMVESGVMIGPAPHDTILMSARRSVVAASAAAPVPNPAGARRAVPLVSPIAPRVATSARLIVTPSVRPTVGANRKRITKPLAARDPLGAPKSPSPATRIRGHSIRRYVRNFVH